jgi:hypothetical protein
MFSSIGVAAALAVLPALDNAPSVIRQFTSVFLVASNGELWQVYDVEAADPLRRHMPTPDSIHPRRVFVAMADQNRMRVYSFAGEGPRNVDPTSLQSQLDAGVNA